MATPFQNYIAGAWTAGPSVTVNRNPSDLADVVGEYAQADAAQASVNQVDEEAESDTLCAGEGARKQADSLHPQPDDPVFETFTHCAGV